MKNLLNRLARILIIALLLVDRTPFLNVYAAPPGGGVIPTVITPTSLAVSVNKPDVTGSVVASTYWGIIKTVDKPVLNLPVAGNEDVTYTVVVSQTTDITFNLTYTVTYVLTGTTPADFSVRSLIAHPSGSTIYSSAVIDTFTDVANQTISKTYTTSFTISEAILETISPFKITIQIFNETDLTNTGLSILTPAINVKNPDVINADGTLSVSDPMDPSSPRSFTLPGTYSYVHNIQSTSLSQVTVNNTATGTTTGGTIINSSASVLVNTINGVPVANSQVVGVTEDTPQAILLTGSDPDGHSITYVVLTLPTKGVLSGDAPNLTYTPNANLIGPDSFTFRVVDVHGALSNVATVSINISNVNDAPVAFDDTAFADEDTQEEITEAHLLSNDTDVDEDTLTITSFTTPDISTGTLSFNTTTRVFTFTPALNFTGNTTFTYTISDGNGGSDVATVTITVNPGNDAPIAIDNEFDTNEDTPIVLTALDYLSDDSDPDLDGFKVISIVPSFTSSEGTLVYDPLTDDITFTPALNFFGTVTFTYTIEDLSPDALTDSATVTINVLPVNDLPVANPDSFNTIEEVTKTFTDNDILANDTDVENTVTFVSFDASSIPASSGLLSKVGDTFTFVPAVDFFGTVSFTYTITDGTANAVGTITINVSDVNEPPVALDNEFDTNEDTMLVLTSLDYLSDDSDPDLDGFKVINILPSFTASEGTLVYDPLTDNITFDPAPNYIGTVTFTYTIEDLDPLDPMSDTATVTINVLEINDGPEAVDDNYSTNEDTQKVVVAPGVLVNDSDIDGDTLTVEVVLGSEPAHGDLVLNIDGSFTYTPNDNYHGPDSFVYEVSDGNGGTDIATVNITVISEEDNPVAIPLNFSVLEGGTYDGMLTGSDDDGDSLKFDISQMPLYYTTFIVNPLTGVFQYVHDGSETSSDIFRFYVSDDDGLTYSDAVDVNITIIPVNDAPLALDDIYSTDEDVDLVVPADGVLGNDTDSDSLVLTSILVSGPSDGSLVLNPDGSFTYTPDANFNGIDSFTYKANDGELDSNVVTVTITVDSVNDRPVADPQDLTTPEDVALPITLTGSDTETPLDSLVFSLVDSPDFGLISGVYPNITYTPDLDFNGDDYFTFTVSDGTLISEFARVDIEVTPVNDRPVAEDDNVITDEDTPILINFVASDLDGDSLIYGITETPLHGTLSGTGASRTYTPDTNFTGIDSFVFGVSDGFFRDYATVTITVNPVNDRPIADDQNLTTPEDVPLSITLTGTDIETPVLFYGVSVLPSHGTISGTAPNLVYTPDENFHGLDTFIFGISDGFYRDYATITIDVTPKNDRPVAEGDEVVTDEDTPILINFVASDVDGDSLIYGITETPLHGTLSGTGSSRTYTPDPNYHGSDSFMFGVSDGKLRAYATVLITVNPINDAPVAIGENYSTPEDTALVIDAPGVLTNDVDVDGDALNAVVQSSPLFGLLSFNSDGSFTYTPYPNYVGLDSFDYLVTDGLLDSNVVSVVIEVTPVNDRPVADPQSLTTPEDTSLPITLTGSDVEGSTLIYGILTGPAHGTLSGTGASRTYTPDLDYVGPDSFTFALSDGFYRASATITIEVTPVNDRPVADPQSLTTPEDTALPITLTGSDVETDPITLFGVTIQPLHGTLSGTAPNLIYTPDLDYNGPDSFTFALSDGFYRASATITIDVTPVNDRPVADPQRLTTPEDTALPITLTATDVEGSVSIFGILSFPSHGTLTGTGANRVYTPDLDYVGPDSFTFALSDGFYRASATITIEVTPVNDRPVADPQRLTTPEDTALPITLTGSDVEGSTLVYGILTGPAHGTLSGTGENRTYTPDLDYVGPDSFTFALSDGFYRASATITIEVTPVNDRPVADAQELETPEDTPLLITLTGSDVETNPITLFGVTVQPEHGTLSGTAPNLTYTPDENYVGPDSFTFALSDGFYRASATITIEVTPVNDPPVANPLAFTVPNAGSSTGLVTASDLDVPADTLTFSLLTPATNGIATVSPTGDYTYTHNGSATASDTFVFSVTDGNGGTANATVTVTVLGAPVVNLPPVAFAQALTVLTGGTLGGTLTGSDPEGAPLAFSLLSGTANGSVVVNVDGTFTYTHNGGASTSDSFLFEVFDGVHTSNATVTITVTTLPPPPPPAPNGAPVVDDGTLSTSFEEPVDGVATGTDPDGDALTFSLVTEPTNGTIVFNPDGTFTYTPNDGFEGTDSFTFIANDGTDDSNIGEFTIDVIEEVIIVEPETPLAAVNNDWLWWLLALLAGLLLWLLAFLRPNMKYVLTDKANNQKIVRRRLAKPDEKTMVVELSDKDLVEVQTIEVEFYKRLAKHCGGVTVNFQLNGKVIHTVTIPNGIDDSFETLIRL